MKKIKKYLDGEIIFSIIIIFFIIIVPIILNCAREEAQKRIQKEIQKKNATYTLVVYKDFYEVNYLYTYKTKKECMSAREDILKNTIEVLITKKIFTLSCERRGKQVGSR